MAATVIINRLTGSGPGKTNITAALSRLSASDVASPGTTNPILIPSAGTNRSYWAVTRLEVTGTPTGTINNIRWYPVGTNPYQSGVRVNVNTATGYTQASGTLGESGTILNTTNYPTLAGAPVDVYTYSSGSALTVAGSMSNPSIGDLGDYVVLQAEADAGVSPGIQPTETGRFQYDET